MQVQQQATDGTKRLFESALSLLRILVPESMAGNLIGKAGATIKNIRTVSGAQVHLARWARFWTADNKRILTVRVVGLPIVRCA